MKKWIIQLVLVCVVAGGGYAAYTAFQAMTKQRQFQIATTVVRQSDVVVRSFTRGELRAVRSVTLTAPNLFGTVQITRLASLGAFAREKDLIVEFDDAEVLSRLEEKQLELDQIDEQIKKSQADLAIRSNQDEVELLRARYAVRRADLEVRKNELISAIDAKKNQLSLDEAKRRLKQLESDIQSRREQAEAELAVLGEKKNKSQLEMNRERARLNQVKLLASISGLVAIKQNRSSAVMFGMQLPDLREGDQVQPGTPVADILDLSEMEVVAKVGEIDRANLREGQVVNIKLDAIADQEFQGTIKSLSGTASANAFSGEVQKKFDVVFSIDMRQLLSSLGAKPDQIARMMATAEANRRKGHIQAIPDAPAAGINLAANAGGPPQQGTTATSGRVRRPGGQDSALAGLTAEQQVKYRESLRKALNGKLMQELKPEERTEVMAKVRKDMAAAGIKLPERSQQQSAGPNMASALAPGGFAMRDVQNAKLPPPPGEDSQFEALLRPGLLADVEIIVEKIPEAINIPRQAVFEKEGRQVVFVRTGSKFEEREVKFSKQSESTMVISSGLKEGEVIALADPTASGSSGKSEKGSSSPTAGMPVPKS